MLATVQKSRWRRQLEAVFAVPSYKLISSRTTTSAGGFSEVNPEPRDVAEVGETDTNGAIAAKLELAPVPLPANFSPHLLL